MTKKFALIVAAIAMVAAFAPEVQAQTYRRHPRPTGYRYAPEVCWDNLRAYPCPGQSASALRPVPVYPPVVYGGGYGSYGDRLNTGETVAVVGVLGALDAVAHVVHRHHERGQLLADACVLGDRDACNLLRAKDPKRFKKIVKNLKESGASAQELEGLLGGQVDEPVPSSPKVMVTK